MSETSNQITIAIPVYERADYFREALKSALSQTINCPIIVVDNHSSHDDFPIMIHQILEENGLSPKSVCYVKNDSNLGMMGNWNRCIELCRTKYISILHDDDLLHPQFVEMAENYLSMIEMDILFTQSVIGRSVPVSFSDKINFSDKIIQVDERRFSFGNFNHAPGTLFAVEKAKKLGMFTNDYGPVLDFDFWLKFTKSYKAFYLPLPLSFYRISALQETNTVYKEMVKNTYKLIDQIPSHRNKCIYLFVRFYIYYGGISNYRKEKNPTDIAIYFADNPEFLKDHKRFSNWFFNLIPQKQRIKEMANSTYIKWLDNKNKIEI